jgi:hypothetical protein
VERTREIGIRRATGARRNHIAAQFLADSVAISGAGSLVGLARRPGLDYCSPLCFCHYEYSNMRFT